MACCPLTDKEEEKLVKLCICTPTPSAQFIKHIEWLSSSNNLFRSKNFFFLKKWLVAVACNNIANARTGANDNTSSLSRALQPIYAWKLFMPLGGHLLLSEHKPTPNALCWLKALTMDPDISEGRKDLVRAFCSVHSRGEIVDPSPLIIIFILQDRKRNGGKGCMNAVLVRNALNAIMHMFVKAEITLWELREYMMILRTCESTPISRNQCTNAIITLITGLYDGEASPDDMNSIIGMLIEYVTANEPGTNSEGALLALHIVSMIPVDNDALRVVQPEDATTLAVKHDHYHIGSLLKVLCDRAHRDYEELFRDIEQSHVNAMVQYAMYQTYKRALEKEKVNKH
jgi:hypothetical protein